PPQPANLRLHFSGPGGRLRANWDFFPRRQRLCLARSVVRIHSEVVLLSVRGILDCHVPACRPCRAGERGTLAGARISCVPRDVICVGLFARGPASERAVSRPGQPEGGVPPSAALARGGQRGCGINVRRQIETYEYTKPVDPPSLLRLASSHLHRLPGQTGGNPPPESALAHPAQTPGERGSFI